MCDILKSTVADSVQLKVEAHIQNGVFFFRIFIYLFLAASSLNCGILDLSSPTCDESRSPPSEGGFLTAGP